MIDLDPRLGGQKCIHGIILCQRNDVNEALSLTFISGFSLQLTAVMIDEIMKVGRGGRHKAAL